MSFEPGSIVKLKVESPNMVVAGESDDHDGWIECIWYDDHESLRDSFPPCCLALVKAADIEAPAKPESDDLPALPPKPAPQPKRLDTPKAAPAGAPEPESDQPEPDAVKVNTASGRITYHGRTCTLAGAGLTIVDITAAAMPHPVDRAEIRNAIWPGGGTVSADTQLSTFITATNQRLTSIGLMLKSVRGKGVVLEEVEG